MSFGPADDGLGDPLGRLEEEVVASERRAGIDRRPLLLVASTGGHLAQLHRLSRRFGHSGVPPVWATFDTPQSRSLLAAERVAHVRYTRSRDYTTVARNTTSAARIIRRARPSALVSTGSAIALSFVPVARALGVPVVYIESAARSEGPSVTGQAMARIPGVRLFTQYPVWADDRWSYAGSVFDEYAQAPGVEPATRPLRVVVSLGTIKYPFRRLVDKLGQVLPADAEVLWQTGETDVSDLPIDARTVVAAAEMKAAVARADVVVAHAGVGSALDALEAGRHPVLVDRQVAFGEHVDEHQRLVAAELDRRGLATWRSVEDLTIDDLRHAATQRNVRVPDPPLLDVLPAGLASSQEPLPSGRAPATGRRRPLAAGRR